MGLFRTRLNPNAAFCIYPARIMLRVCDRVLTASTYLMREMETET